VWFDGQAVAGWRNTEPSQGPGAPRLYAGLAIACALVFKSVYHLSLRAAQGFLSSVLELMRLRLPVPDYSTVSRRQGVLQVQKSSSPSSGPRHVGIDATGLRVYGAGEWRRWKHRVGRRRTWCKLHLGVDEDTKEIVAGELTESRVHDSQQLPSLLSRLPSRLGRGRPMRHVRLLLAGLIVAGWGQLAAATEYDAPTQAICTKRIHNRLKLEGKSQSPGDGRVVITDHTRGDCNG
jgi:hypothetical protein